MLGKCIASRHLHNLDKILLDCSSNRVSKQIGIFTLVKYSTLFSAFMEELCNGEEIMVKAYKYRIYPTKEQEQLLMKTLGCCRFVYNWYLNKRKTAYEENGETLDYYACTKDLTQLKKEYVWLQEVDSSALQNALRDLDAAFKKFFKKQAKYPKYKSKYDHRKSFRSNCGRNGIRFENGRIRLPKIGEVKARNQFEPEGRIVNATISQEPSGKCYISLCCTDVEMDTFEKTGNNIGIKLGLKYYYTSSDGEEVVNPKFLQKSLAKIGKLQRQLSRKEKGSANYEKARVRLARLHEHVANQRDWYLQNLTTEIVRKYDVICIQNIDVSELLSDSTIALDVADAAWYKFIRMLEYKAEWHGRQVIKVESGNEVSMKSLYASDVDESKRILKEGLKILGSK